MKKFGWLKYALWLLLPLLLWWALRELPVGEIFGTIRALSALQIMVLVVLNILIVGVFSSRWWLILRALGHRLSYLPPVAYRLSAFSISYFTPGTQFGGEPLQVHLLQSRHQISSSSALASVSLDKVFELTANFLFLALGIILIFYKGIFFEITPAQLGAIMIVLILLPIAYLFFLWSGKHPLAWMVDKAPPRLKAAAAVTRVSQIVVRTEIQAASLLQDRPVTILWASISSLVIWALMLAEYWLTLRFLGAQVNLFQAVIALSAARLAFLTPLPGGVGALEASQVFAMGALGYNPALGISVSLLIRARDILIGLAGLCFIAIMTRRKAAVPLPSQAGD